MSRAHPAVAPHREREDSALLCPFTLDISPIGRFLNCELADDPVYDGVELQYFDDPIHGTGLLAFLSRREDRRVDYYYEPGLVLDRAGYAIGGGTGTWTETTFSAARLDVGDDGVAAEVRFTDIDGRAIEIVVDDRGGRRRRRGRLLAPVGAGVEHPTSLLLVLLHDFDLVRLRRTPPVIRIAGRSAAIGRLPGTRLHRHLLVKYAAPVCATELNRATDRTLMAGRNATQTLEVSDERIAAVRVEQDGHRAHLELRPPLPDIRALPENVPLGGTWNLTIDDERISGGAWSARRGADTVQIQMSVTSRWEPSWLPPLIRLVTRVLPVFRQWPLSYRWQGTVTLGPTPLMTSRWERTTGDRGDDYLNATQ